MGASQECHSAVPLLAQAAGLRIGVGYLDSCTKIFTSPGERIWGGFCRFRSFLFFCPPFIFASNCHKVSSNFWLVQVSQCAAHCQSCKGTGHACPVGRSFAAHVARSQVDNLWSDIQVFSVSRVKTFTTFKTLGLKNTKLVDSLFNSLNFVESSGRKFVCELCWHAADSVEQHGQLAWQLASWIRRDAWRFVQEAKQWQHGPAQNKAFIGWFLKSKVIYSHFRWQRQHSLAVCFFS